MAGSNTDDGRGSAWRIWDLHVHTPASIVQHYGDESDETWSRFIDELEALPEDVAVIGINDYWFFDGYRRVVKAKRSGRLRNLDAIFPVVEMRLDQFGGTAGKLSRVNLHVVFDPELDPELIQAQFVNALQPKLKLSPSQAHIGWQGVITKESLIDLGRRIKESVPKDQVHNYDSDLREGFNNINVSLDSVRAVLERQFFHGRALVGIGKTEWRDIKWNDQSIAAKKTVINSADFIFTAYPDTARWQSDVQALRDDRVNHQILDCSDAHYFSDSSQSMRIGACQTWMNTVPTLAGLAYAIAEFDRRVYVGLEPPALSRVRTNPEWFISSVRVASDRPDHDLFDHDLRLNPGFVAVVGNKGQGKSALLDCIALGGNSSRNSEFAFLRPSRFLSATNQRVAREYTTELRWFSGFSRRLPLNGEYDRSAPVAVEYLPQAFVERVCNIDPQLDDTDEFEHELRTILFTHISDSQRAGEKTFDALLAQTTRVSQDDLARRRSELHAAIASYSRAASFRAENHADEIRGRLKLKDGEVTAATDALLDARRTLTEHDLAGNDDGQLRALRHRSEEIDVALAKLQSERTENEQRQATIRQALAAMRTVANRADAVRSDVAELNELASDLLNTDGDPYLTLTIDQAAYDRWRASLGQTLVNLNAAEDTLLRDIAAQERARRTNTEALAAADSARERARQRVLQAEARRDDLIGDEDDEESLKGLQSLLERITKAPAELDRLRTAIVNCSGQIYTALAEQLDAVKGLYQPATNFITTSEVVKNAGLAFNAELRILPTWRSVASGLDGRRNGDFSDWLTQLPQRLEGTSWSQLAPALTEAITRLEHERGDVAGEFRDPATALRSTTTLLDFLTSMLDLSWLEVRFGLTGDGLPLSQLSPGQRGLVLALFYLVVDRRKSPLLLDQPEENLDNETIASKLVPAIHESAGRRQTIVVTHNANLAIVGDADQIVHCQLKDGRFTVASGSIAELDVAQFALNVLEGTKLAFDNRRHKYEAFPQLT
ncbi:TrlF family AAA-like ATPase [Kribbella sp. NPDC059898]|uniref:TrlF family AAA-like ATPase n=1 Tax=Kribbella sp. NPDC059898 TaxID=3346995 RepID=UPI00365634CE